MRVLACGFLVADIVVAGLDRIANPGELVYAPRGILLTVGGHPANIAIDLVKLGATPSEIAVCGTVGKDVFGDFILKTLRKHGIRLFVKQVAASTNKNVILVVKGEDRRFHVELGASNLLQPRWVTSFVEKEKPRIFYLASGITNLVDKEIDSIFKKAKENNSLTFADVVPPQGKGWEFILPALPYVDVFHCNEAEALNLVKTTDLEEAIRSLLKLGVKLLLITRGEKGALAATVYRILEQPAFKVDVVDPTGAGDAFCAGVISWLLEKKLQTDELTSLGGDELAELLLYGQAAGAAACTAPGTTEGVTRAKVNALVDEQKHYLLAKTSLERCCVA
ncbi:MAG: carbohydrate kinase family protein [Thermofilaceae archaeon]